MTRVLMTADTVGGVWTYALELADALAPHGVTVELALMGRPMSDAQRAAVARSAVTAVHESTYALEWMPDPWHDVDRAGAWLRHLEQSMAPDVVHLNGYAHASLPWRAPVLVVAHSCVFSWWSAVHRTEPPAAWATYRDRVAAGLHRATVVVAPTRWMLDQLARWYGFSGGDVVPNCRRRDWVREADKEQLVVAAGRVWDEAKNLALLEQAAPSVAWPVVIAGDAPGAAGAAPPSATPRFVGELGFEDLAPLLLRASVFAAPARYEPFGLAALEAAHAGCALVLGDIPSLHEVWDECALYVDPDDPEGLAACLTSLAADPPRVQAMGRHAQARAARYLPQTTAAAYVALYQRLLAPEAVHA